MREPSAVGKTNFCDKSLLPYPQELCRLAESWMNRGYR
jgi:hypothetical protein